MSEATLNRVITAVVERAQTSGVDLPHFCVHDLRRTASTLLHEAGFNTDWIEKCLAHEQKGVRAVYNKAEYADQRREMLQSWADMIDGWIVGAKLMPFRAGRSATFLFKKTENCEFFFGKTEYVTKLSFAPNLIK